jgi:hypothetical protein
MGGQPISLPEFVKAARRAVFCLKDGFAHCFSFILGLAGTFLGILGVLVLFTGAVTHGMIVLVTAFLVSPFGIPMAAAWLLGKIQDLRYTIQDHIYG